MAKQIYEVRKDTLEDFIAFYDSVGDYGGGRALRRLAKRINCPLDEEAIKALTLQKRKHYEQLSPDDAEKERGQKWEGSPESLT